MNLLFLLPDFFFRDTFYEYKWIVEAIVDGLDNDKFNDFDCQAKIYCGEELKALLIENRPSAEDFFVEIAQLGILNQRKAFPPSNWCISDSEKIWAWTTDFDLKSFYSKRQVLLLNSIYKKYSFTHVIHWGNNVPLASWCVEREVKYYFVEMGFMRSPSIESLVIDTCGVNSLSSIAKSEEKDFALKFDFNIQILQESVYEAHNSDYSAHCRSQLCFDSPNVFESYNSLSVNIAEDCNLEDNSRALKFGIFLQLTDDTQIIGGSGFRSMHEYLKYIIPNIRSMHGDDSEIYVRFHPGALSPSSRPVNVLDAHNCRQLIQNLPDVYELDLKQSWHDQILYFNSIFTINSSIAFEAWLFSPSLEIVVSGIPGWYPSAYLYHSFMLSDGKIEKFCYLLDNKILKGAALYSLGGYLYHWDRDGQSLINCVLHRIFCESLALSAPNLRFGLPGPGTKEVMPRASITSHTQIYDLFSRNFCPSPIAGDKLSILEFLSKQRLRFFNDIFSWSDNKSFPFTLSCSYANSSLMLKEKSDEKSVERVKSKSLTLFIVGSNFRVLCKRVLDDLNISSEPMQVKVPFASLEICESQCIYIYAFLSPLYDLSSDRGSFKIAVNNF